VSRPRHRFAYGSASGTLARRIPRSCLVLLLAASLIPAGAVQARSKSGKDRPRDAVFLYGNIRTRDYVVLRELRDLPAGRPSDAWLAKRGAWLERLGPFRSALLVTMRDSARAVPRLAVLLKEKSGWSLDPALSYDGLFGWIAGCAVDQHNLFGRNQLFRAGFTTGGIDKQEIFWSDPWFCGPLRLFAELAGSHVSYPYRYPDYRPVFRVTSDAASAVLGRGFGRSLAVGYRRTWERMESGDPAALLSGGRRDELVSDECFGRWDRRDRVEYPLSGQYAIAGREWTEESVTGRRFGRSYFDCRAYLPASSGSCLAVQAAGQLLDGRIPVVKRLHWGGSSTLRGYDSGVLAGDRLLAFGAELRFPILLEPEVLGARRAGIFGVWFAECASIRFAGASRTLEPNVGTSGFGVHFIWDTIVLRAEWGVRADGGVFVTSSSGVKF
jgi:outer membrane protein assembly factor BamA